MSGTEDRRDTPALRIGEVARRTGVTVATLRAWERRFGLLSPNRTAGGQRLYRDVDVARVLDMVGLIEAGWSVGAAAAHVLDTERDQAVMRPRTSERAHPAAARAADDRSQVSRTGSDAGAGGVVLARDHDAPSLAILAFLADVDIDAAAAGYTAARDVLTAASPADVRAALIGLVEAVGGSVVPADVQSDEILPVDLSCGEGDPLLPRAAPYSLARLRLEMLLPALVEQARHRLVALRQAGRS